MPTAVKGLTLHLAADAYATDPIRHRKFTLAQFPEALNGIKGGLRVRRRSWTENSYIAMQDPDDKSVISVPYIYLKTTEGPIVLDSVTVRSAGV